MIAVIYHLSSHLATVYKFPILPSTGIMFLSQNMSESCEDLTLWLTNLTHCNPYMPPYNVHVTYGKNTLILRKNGSSSTLGPKCISLHPPTCQTNGTMELRLSLNASDERCQNSTLSRVVAKYEDVIQQQASVNVTGLLIPSAGAFCACAYELMLCACAYELMQ